MAGLVEDYACQPLNGQFELKGRDQWWNLRGYTWVMWNAEGEAVHGHLRAFSAVLIDVSGTFGVVSLPVALGILSIQSSEAAIVDQLVQRVERECVELGCGRDASTSNAAMRVGLRKSLNEHEAADRRWFARIQFGKGMAIGCYSGTLMYANLNGDKDFDRSYEKGVIYKYLSMKKFHVYAVHVSNDVRDSDAVNHHAWVFSTWLKLLCLLMILTFWK